ncbi:MULTISPECIES: LysR family transcriptional regulator [unclassified Companilactobacillus]|uniref:LysR family transcriptional regulator n=1 Tax=unclassified Companilactobacillus TaxID=2767904 RepID=UPI002FF0250F
METRLLKYFLTIAQTGTISQASRELHVTQPTLSRQLKTLEEELGTELFIRKQRQMVLTNAGVQLQTDAKQILSMLNQAKTRVQETNNKIVGTIAIGCIESNAAKLLAQTIKRYHKQFPGVKIELYDLDSTDIQERLDQGLLDVGIVLKPSETAKYFVKDLQLKDYWGVVVSKSAFLKKDNISKAELRNIPIFITRNNLIQAEMTTLLEIPLSELDIIGKQNLVSNSLYLAQNQTAYPLCARGAFVGDTDDLKFLPLKDANLIEQQVIWSKQRKISDLIQKFIDLLVSEDQKVLGNG